MQAIPVRHRHIVTLDQVPTCWGIVLQVTIVLLEHPHLMLALKVIIALRVLQVINLTFVLLVIIALLALSIIKINHVQVAITALQVVALRHFALLVTFVQI